MIRAVIKVIVPKRSIILPMKKNNLRYKIKNQTHLIIGIHLIIGKMIQEITSI